MKVSEAIDRLEVGETVWVKATLDMINDKGRYVRVMPNASSVYLDGHDEISLAEPQAEKVEVKQCVAEFYEANKDDLNFAIYEAVAHSIKECGYKAYPEGFMDWLIQSSNNPFETLIRMKVGYTVKPNRLVVKNEEGRYFVAFSKYAKTPFEGVFSASVTNLVTFDDKAKAEAVATLVEGTVEEV